VSQQNVEIVRALYLSKRPLVDSTLIARDAEFDFTELYPDQPVLRGVDEMQRFRDAGPWGSSIHFEPERYIDLDDERVLVIVHVDSTGQQSGIPVRRRVAQEFTLRRGLVVRVKTHAHPGDALKAAGLSDQ
jgi:hypothetical protein